MLINTNQLVSLVDLRINAGSIVAKAKSGMIFYITDKGNLMAKLTPIEEVFSGSFNFFTEMDALIEKSAKSNKTKKKDSTKAIREMRDNRYGA